MAETADRKALGAAGEELAVHFLREKGYRIRKRNYRTRYGEIDIIAEQGGDLVFVEVKLRRGSTYGKPQEAVTAAKRRHLAQAALQYLKEIRSFNRSVRFDVLSIGPGSTELIAAAFTVDDCRYSF